jgi:hypothetical protein
LLQYLTITGQIILIPDIDNNGYRSRRPGRLLGQFHKLWEQYEREIVDNKKTLIFQGSGCSTLA